ncbi:MAG: rhomboid family protein [Opitutus sp.]|nr:rhomboid family protein [Opitutus sp.]
MNAPPIPVVPSGAGQLHVRRCARHVAREAAVRCPGCAEFFCRECVVEHDGKLLCAACVTRAVGVEKPRRQRLAALRRMAATLGGVLLLWLIFYALGAVLLKIPPNFHDGTVWKKLVEPS